MRQERRCSLVNERAKPEAKEQELVRGWGGDQPREEGRRHRCVHDLPGTKYQGNRWWGEAVTHPLGALILF